MSCADMSLQLHKQENRFMWLIKVSQDQGRGGGGGLTMNRLPGLSLAGNIGRFNGKITNGGQ